MHFSQWLQITKKISFCKPELSHIFSELRIPSILEVLELFQGKSELRVLFGVDIENPNFWNFSMKSRMQSSGFNKKEHKVRVLLKSRTQCSGFHWNNSRTSKIDEILNSEKSCESSGFPISLTSGIIKSKAKFGFSLKHGT